MPVAKLKEPKMSADGIERFAFRDDKILIQSAGRDRAGFGPALEERLGKLALLLSAAFFVMTSVLLPQTRLSQVEVALDASQRVVVDERSLRNCKMVCRSTRNASRCSSS